MEKAIVAIESTGFATPIYDFLKENGYETKVAHPLKTRAIAEAKIKSDKIDARILADFAKAIDEYLSNGYPWPDKIEPAKF